MYKLSPVIISNFVSRRGVLRGLGTAAVNKVKKQPEQLVTSSLAKVKSTAKNLNTVRSNLDELGTKGNNVLSRRKLFKGAKNKVLIEAGKRPKATNKTLGTLANKVKGIGSNLNGMNIAEKLNKVKLGRIGKLASKITNFL